jgi:NAD-dependent dihydropyrimidine dehydrogenase PreA subunit
VGVRLAALAACVLLAAHWLRAGEAGLGVLALAAGGSAFTGRVWARLVLAGFLAWGAAVWTLHAGHLVQVRAAMGLEWTRLAAIMSAVLALDLAVLALLVSPAGSRAFARSRPGDAVRGATVLLTAGLLMVSREAAASRAGLDLLILDRAAPGWGGLEILVLAAWAGWLAGALHAASGPGWRRLRGRAWALFSAVFFIQALLGVSGVAVFLMTGRLHLPVPALVIAGPLYRGHGFFMPILFTASVLLLGAGWCSFLCYVGSWDLWSSRIKKLSRRLGPRLMTPPRHPRVRLFLLSFVVAAALGLRLAGVGAGWAVAAGAGFGLVGVLIMLAISSRMGFMMHCSHYCPLGLLADLLGRCTPWRVRVGEGCTRCGACVAACRYGALSLADVDAGRPGLTCSLCGDCVAVCGEGAMSYRLGSLGPGKSRGLFIVLAASLHALFLGVARI